MSVGQARNQKLKEETTGTADYWGAVPDDCWKRGCADVKLFLPCLHMQAYVFVCIEIIQ